jgi:predicted NUDIX family phosphoesterase
MRIVGRGLSSVKGVVWRGRRVILKKRFIVIVTPSETMEQIAYVPNEALSSLLGDSVHEHFYRPGEQWRRALEDNLQYGPREPLETDTSKKQLIGYCALTHQGEVYTFRRGSDIKEDRLQGDWSIGWGGHIEQVDEGVDKGLYRELHEELHLPNWGSCAEFEGFIFDSSDQVGCVHVGMAYRLETPSQNPVDVSETDKHPTYGWKPWEELDVTQMETWSQSLSQHLAGNQTSQIYRYDNTYMMGPSLLEAWKCIQMGHDGVEGRNLPPKGLRRVHHVDDEDVAYFESHHPNYTGIIP